jgi:hypothetical protein
LEIPKFTDLEMFLLSGWVSYIIIRLAADSIKLRLYVDLKHLRVKVGRPPKQSIAGTIQGLTDRALGRQKPGSNIHIHHFIFGMVLMPLTFIVLYWHFWFSPVLVGVVMALVFSEIKELVLMSWGQ